MLGASGLVVLPTEGGEVARSEAEGRRGLLSEIQDPNARRSQAIPGRRPARWKRGPEGPLFHWHQHLSSGADPHGLNREFEV